jgi:hypothetical protein
MRNVEWKYFAWKIKKNLISETIIRNCSLLPKGARNFTFLLFFHEEKDGKTSVLEASLCHFGILPRQKACHETPIACLTWQRKIPVVAGIFQRNFNFGGKTVQGLYLLFLENQNFSHFFSKNSSLSLWLQR